MRHCHSHCSNPISAYCNNFSLSCSLQNNEIQLSPPDWRGMIVSAFEKTYVMSRGSGRGGRRRKEERKQGREDEKDEEKMWRRMLMELYTIFLLWVETGDDLILPTQPTLSSFSSQRSTQAQIPGNNAATRESANTNWWTAHKIPKFKIYMRNATPAIKQSSEPNAPSFCSRSNLWYERSQRHLNRCFSTMWINSIVK